MQHKIKQKAGFIFPLFVFNPLRLILLPFVCIFIAPKPLYSTVEGQLKEAAEYVDAGQYIQAQDIYESLLTEQLLSHQKNVLLYNLGTSYIEQGNYGQALSTFHSIPLETSTHPLLRKRILENTIIALLKLADSLPTNGTDSLEKSLYYYREAHDNLTLAIQANCALLKAEGAGQCFPSTKLKELEILIKEHYATHVEQLRDLRIHQADVTEGILFYLLV